MIVLDEQLMGRDLDNEIARWYPGSVRFIIDLRPGTIIKDDAIPALLREQEGIPEILRSLFRTPGFGTKGERMGKIVRTTTEGSSFYSIDESDVRAVSAP